MEVAGRMRLGIFSVIPFLDSNLHCTLDTAGATAMEEAKDCSIEETVSCLVVVELSIGPRGLLLLFFFVCDLKF